MAPDRTTEALETAQDACSTLDDRKALDILLLDVRNLSQVTDYILLATGTSSPHLKALAGEVQRALKQKRSLHCYRKAGNPDGEWIVLDYVDVIIHILSPEARNYYAIEELWSQAPRIPAH